MDGYISSVLTEKTFMRFSEFITSELGIKMPEMKKTMLQGRLSRRLKALKLNTYDEYYDYIFTSNGQKEELKYFFDAVTTNKTEFFRESRHFDYLVNNVLPTLLEVKKKESRNRITVWSAGCSNGAEPYTLCMVLSDYGEKIQDFEYSILATDISTSVLRKAREAIYSEDEIDAVPMEFRKKYLLRSKSRKDRLIRMSPAVRSKVRFHRLNFMDDTYAIADEIDIVFFRNVLIYFDRDRQQKVLSRVCRHLNHGGYLFSGHSETLSGLDLPLRCEVTTIYRKT